MWAPEAEGDPARMRAELADMPTVSVTRTGYSKKAPRRVFDIRGLAGRGTIWTHSNDCANTVHSVHERVLGRTAGGTWTPTLLPLVGAFQTAEMVAFRRGVCRRLGRHSLPVTVNQFLGHYRGQKRRRYEAAARSLESKPVVRADSYPSVFLKPEKWVDDKAGRLISARSPRYNLAVGRYLLPAEPRVYEAVDGVWGSATIMKGYTPERRAAVVDGHWAAFQRPVAVGMDFSKYDQHISQPALQYEHGFYLGMYDGDAELQRLLSWQLSTTCYANVRDGTVKYKVTGGRMSGDMNTAMGNCIITAALIHSYSAEMGIRTRAMVDGDDSVVFMEKGDLQRFIAGIVPWMRTRGFILVVEAPAFEKHAIEFCQCRYVAMETPTMVRNPYKALTQDHAWIEDKSITWAEVLAATGLGGLSLYGHVPVLGAYYEMLASTTTASKRTLDRLDFRSSWLRDASFTGTSVEPTERARYEFWRTWGMSPGEQRLHEADFRSTRLQDLFRGDPRITSQRIEKADPYGNNYYLSTPP